MSCFAIMLLLGCGVSPFSSFRVDFVFDAAQCSGNVTVRSGTCPNVKCPNAWYTQQLQGFGPDRHWVFTTTVANASSQVTMADIGSTHQTEREPCQVRFALDVPRDGLAHIAHAQCSSRNFHALLEPGCRLDRQSPPCNQKWESPPLRCDLPAKPVRHPTKVDFGDCLNGRAIHFVGDSHIRALASAYFLDRCNGNAGHSARHHARSGLCQHFKKYEGFAAAGFPVYYRWDPVHEHLLTTLNLSLALQTLGPLIQAAHRYGTPEHRLSVHAPRRPEDAIVVGSSHWALSNFAPLQAHISVMRKLLAALRRRFAAVVLLGPPLLRPRQELRPKESGRRHGNKMELWTLLLRQTAAQAGVPFIDSYAITQRWLRIPEGLHDSYHWHGHAQDEMQAALRAALCDQQAPFNGSAAVGQCDYIIECQPIKSWRNVRKK